MASATKPESYHEDARGREPLADSALSLFNGGTRTGHDRADHTYPERRRHHPKERLTDQGLYQSSITRRQESTHRDPLRPTTLRTYLCRCLLELAWILSTVQKLMGHAHANTTSGYDRRGERDKREAVRQTARPLRAPVSD